MEDPLPTFTTLVERIRDAHPNLAYIHVIEDLEGSNDENGSESEHPLRKIWGSRPYIAAGGFNRASATNTVERLGGLIAFGRDFISNVGATLRSMLEMVSHDYTIA
jgi:NADPH2 dehydrogenase